MCKFAINNQWPTSFTNGNLQIRAALSEGLHPFTMDKGVAMYNLSTDEVNLKNGMLTGAQLVYISLSAPASIPLKSYYLNSSLPFA
jgi:hypothetical protein